jgi:transcriptional regulator with XRE-family HTH domain
MRELLKLFRRAAGLTLAKAARRLGVHISTLSAWENARAKPRPDKVKAMAELYGVEALQIEKAFYSANVAALV